MSEQREALAEARERVQRAIARLEERRDSPATGMLERGRLGGKVEGVKLALAYLDGDLARLLADAEQRGAARGWGERMSETHWVGDAPTSLHGNGAASFEHTTRNVAEVTCRLCRTLLARGEHEA